MKRTRMAGGHPRSFFGLLNGVRQVHDLGAVAGMGEELCEDITGFQLQAAGADAGVAGEVLRLVDRAVDEEVDPVLRVVHEAQDGTSS